MSTDLPDLPETAAGLLEGSSGCSVRSCKELDGDARTEDDNVTDSETINRDPVLVGERHGAHRCSSESVVFWSSYLERVSS